MKVGHWRKEILEGYAPFSSKFNFLQQKDIRSINLTFFYLSLFASETEWEVFLFQSVGRVIVT